MAETRNHCEALVGPCIARGRMQLLGFDDPMIGFAEVHSVSQLVGESGSLQCCRAGTGRVTVHAFS